MRCERRPGSSVRCRLDQAEEAIVDAELLAGVRHWNPCVNRLYYACFYAVSALLLRHGYSSSKHSGVRSLFNRHFGRSGLIAPELVTEYNDLFERRHDADYSDLVYCEEEAVRPRIADAQRFVARIEALLAAPGGEEAAR